MLSATLAKYDIKQIGLECTIIHVNFVSKIFVRNFLITIFSFISMHTIYSPYIVVLVKKISHKNFRHSARDENFLTAKFPQITVE